MNNQAAGVTTRNYTQVLVRRRWTVISAVLLSAVVAPLLTALQTPIYAASPEVLAQPRRQHGLFEDQVRNQSDRSIQDNIQVIEGHAGRDRVHQALGLETCDVSAAPVGQTDVISFFVRDTNAPKLATYANAYIDLRQSEQSVNDLLAARTEVQTVIDGHQADLDGADRFSVYSFGAVPSNPSELLGGRRTRQLAPTVGTVQNPATRRSTGDFANGGYCSVPVQPVAPMAAGEPAPAKV